MLTELCVPSRVDLYIIVMLMLFMNTDLQVFSMKLRQFDGRLWQRT